MTTDTDCNRVAPELNLIAVNRVNGLSQRAADYLLVLLAAHLMENGAIDRAKFLLLADEAEAIAS